MNDEHSPRWEVGRGEPVGRRTFIRYAHSDAGRGTPQTTRTTANTSSSN